MAKKKSSEIQILKDFETPISDDISSLGGELDQSKPKTQKATQAYDLIVRSLNEHSASLRDINTKMPSLVSREELKLDDYIKKDSKTIGVVIGVITVAALLIGWIINVWVMGRFNKLESEMDALKCKNGVILECYNKCNLQEILKRQNTCEATK